MLARLRLVCGNRHCRLVKATDVSIWFGLQKWKHFVQSPRWTCRRRRRSIVRVHLLGRVTTCENVLSQGYSRPQALAAARCGTNARPPSAKHYRNNTEALEPSDEADPHTSGDKHPNEACSSRAPMRRRRTCKNTSASVPTITHKHVSRPQLQTPSIVAEMSLSPACIMRL